MKHSHDRPGILMPVATRIEPTAADAAQNRPNGFRMRNGKPILRVTPGMKLRDFLKVGEDGVTRAYTPKLANKNPDCPDCFLVGLYKSPTGVFIPREQR